MDSLITVILSLLFWFVFLPVIFTWFWVEVFRRLSALSGICTAAVALLILMALSNFLPQYTANLQLRDLVKTSSVILVVGALFWSLARPARKAENELEL